ncbi:MAG: glycerol-3-phosphate 1-O-acyltransferase PlsY [Phycisphaerales bacterium]|nr:glycerol-3-phosphate 1-O-acyltransferase PlsY [Phycisphaerales bacterium]
MTSTQWVIGIIAAYFAGSIPFGVIIARIKGVNIRERGSKNIGATNVGRVLGKPLGVTCFVLDVLKGAIPMIISGIVAGTFGEQLDQITATELLLWVAVAFSALLGHMYSPWLKFGGGKGVATTLGGMLAMWPLLTVPVLIAFASWVIAVKATKIISLGSLVAAIVLFLATVVLVCTKSTISHAWPLLIVTFVIGSMVFWKHRSNIARIIRGQEPKLGGSTK